MSRDRRYRYPLRIWYMRPLLLIWNRLRKSSMWMRPHRTFCRHHKGYRQKPFWLNRYLADIFGTYLQSKRSCPPGNRYRLCGLHWTFVRLHRAYRLWNLQRRLCRRRMRHISCDRLYRCQRGKVYTRRRWSRSCRRRSLYTRKHLLGRFGQLGRVCMLSRCLMRTCWADIFDRCRQRMKMCLKDRICSWCASHWTFFLLHMRDILLPPLRISSRLCRRGRFCGQLYRCQRGI